MPRFTRDEISHLLSCLRIALEDGSIYGGHDDPAEMRAIDERSESIERKLKAAQEKIR